MSSSLQSLLPTLLVASPLLLGAAPSPAPNTIPSTIQSSCVETNTLQDTTAGHIAHPIQSAQQVLITTGHEWMAVNATPIDSQCTTKEDPGETTGEEITPQVEETEEGEIPDLDPSAVPAPMEETIPETTDSSEPITEDATEPNDTTPDATAPDAMQAPTTAPPTATPIPTRTVAPPPSDPALDPGNFTPADPAPTPFDGSVIPTLESFPNGSYRYLAGEFEYGNYTNEQLSANGGAIFLLTKVGNEVTGNLSDTFGQPGICITGTLSGNTITGAAYPIATNDEDTEGLENVGESFASYGSSGLQVRQPQTVGDRTYYADALLNLANFSRINAGTALAPTVCVVPTTNAPASDDVESE